MLSRKRLMSKILVIAEAGISHQGNMSLAKEMVLRAKQAGADCFKTQLYDVDTLFPDKQITAQDRNWYKEVKRTQLTKEQVFELANYCKQFELEFMASCYDLERLSWLEKIGVKRHKIGTRANKNWKLISEMLKTNKEILYSCQVRDFTSYIFQFSVIKYLYCIPEYPTSLEKLKFREIAFPLEFQGFSSHYPGIEPALVAMARGAQIVEVHFCLSRKIVTGPDITSSIEPDELRQLVRFARKVEEIL